MTKRAEIRGIAVRLALEHGPDAATVEAISEAADIAPRTFFNYFPSKDDAFSIEPHQWTVDEIVAELRSRPSGEPPVESMRAVIMAMAEAAKFAEFAQEWELLQELYRRHPELFARIRVDHVDTVIAALSVELSARGGGSELYSALLVGASFAALQAAENRSRAGDRPLGELIGDSFDILAQGLSTIR